MNLLRSKSLIFLAPVNQALACAFNPDSSSSRVLMCSSRDLTFSSSMIQASHTSRMFCSNCLPWVSSRDLSLAISSCCALNLNSYSIRVSSSAWIFFFASSSSQAMAWRSSSAFSLATVKERQNESKRKGEATSCSRDHNATSQRLVISSYDFHLLVQIVLQLGHGHKCIRSFLLI